MKKLFVLFILGYMIAQNTFGQGVAINTTGARPDSSAMLDVSDTSKGILIPRMTMAQRNLIPSPANSLLIFQTDQDSGYYYYNAPSSTWLKFGTNSSNAQTPIIRTYASNATWVKQPGLKYIIVELVGGGGGGGWPNIGSLGSAGAGGGGGYAKSIISPSSLGSSEVIIIGNGGNGGESQATTGGTTSFGSLVSASGGDPGGSASANSGGHGGIGLTGDILLSGEGGQFSIMGPTSVSVIGGSSILGGGSRFNDGNYGGGGGYNYINHFGANGSKGIVIVVEYY